MYEVLSDVNSRQDIMDERIASMEDRMNSIQCSLDVLPDILTRLVLFSTPFRKNEIISTFQMLLLGAS